MIYNFKLITYAVQIPRCFFSSFAEVSVFQFLKIKHIQQKRPLIMWNAAQCELGVGNQLWKHAAQNPRRAKATNAQQRKPEILQKF
jgi:hypothetical protein